MDTGVTEIVKSLIATLPQLVWAVVAIVIFILLRRPVISLFATAKTVEVELPGGVKIAVAVQTTKEITQDLIDYLGTLTANQVRLLFSLIRIEKANQQYVIPKPTANAPVTAHNRENQFHKDLRALREGHLIHAIDGGKAAGRFKPGRLVKLFQWAFKLPELALGAKSASGVNWAAEHALVNAMDVTAIHNKLDQDADGP